MTFDPLITGAIGLGIIIIFFIVWIIKLELKLKKILKGKDAETLDQSIHNLDSQIKSLEKFEHEVTTYLLDVERRLKRSVQAVETIRFNAFKGTGGGSNQSFATAFLNEDGDGVVFSSLYSRDHVSVFSKPIEKKASAFELSTEEKSALKSAETKIGGK